MKKSADRAVPSEARLCDSDCNHCPIINHPNSRLLTAILNQAHDKFGNDFYRIVQDACPNLTCCKDCHIDDFCHIEGCEIMEHNNEINLGTP